MKKMYGIRKKSSGRYLIRLVEWYWGDWSKDKRKIGWNIVGGKGREFFEDIVEKSGKKDWEVVEIEYSDDDLKWMLEKRVENFLK